MAKKKGKDSVEIGGRPRRLKATGTPAKIIAFAIAIGLILIIISIYYFNVN